MAAVARPVVVVVDDQDASRQALAHELEGRYGAHYRIMCSASPEEALAGLEQLRGASSWPVPDLAERRSLQREPYLLETSTPGGFAVGDVRHGSVKRVASAVGDGAIVIRLAHDYLA
jgi:CheY-like chemotaxis protein